MDQTVVACCAYPHEQNVTRDFDDHVFIQSSAARGHGGHNVQVMIELYYRCQQNNQGPQLPTMTVLGLVLYTRLNPNSLIAERIDSATREKQESATPASPSY
jgi:hypothetical protein